MIWNGFSIAIDGKEKYIKLPQAWVYSHERVEGS